MEAELDEDIEAELATDLDDEAPPEEAFDPAEGAPEGFDSVVDEQNAPSWPVLGHGILSGFNLHPRSSHVVLNDPARGGALEVIGIGTDNGIWFKRQAAWGSPWQGTGRPGQVVRIDALPSANGLHVYGVGTDGNAYTIHRNHSDQWSYWDRVPMNLGLLGVSDVQVVPGTDSDDVLFTLDAWGMLRAQPINDAQAQPSDTPLHGRWFGAPLDLYAPTNDGIASFSVERVANTLQIVAHGKDGSVYRRGQELVDRQTEICTPLGCEVLTYKEAQWGAWQRLPFQFCTPVSCLNVEPHVVQVVAGHTPDGGPGGERFAAFAINNGDVYVNYLASLDAGATFSGWRQLPFDRDIMQIAVANNGEGGAGRGRLEVFGVAAQERTIWSVWQTSVQSDTWGGTLRLSQNPMVNLSAASNSDGRIELVAAGVEFFFGDNTLYLNWQIYEWWGIRWFFT